MNRASKWLALCLIAFLGLSMGVGLVYSSRMEAELLSTTMPLQDACMMVKGELDSFHLLLEEHLYRDGITDTAEIFRHLDRAQWLGRAMIEGGKDEEWTYRPLADDSLRDEIEAMNSQLRAVRRFAQMRLARVPGTPPDRETEEMFEFAAADAGSHASTVEREFHKAMIKKQADNRDVMLGILLLCGMFTVGAVAVTYGYITTRGRAEESLSGAYSFLQDIVDGVDEPIMVVDTGYNVTLMNSAARRMSGTKPGAPAKCHEISHRLGGPCHEDGIACPLESVRKSGRTEVVEHAHFGEHKAPRVMEVIASPWLDDSGRFKGIIQCSRDITKRRELERQRSDFYAMVTHDIKSPLTAMAGYADLILEGGKGPLADDMREMVRLIRKSCDRILQMVQDFLSASQLEAGKLALNPYPADIAKLLRETCAEMEEGLGRKGLAFDADIPDGLPAVMYIDAKLVQRAIYNLLANAAAYTPEGTVSLSVGLEGRGIEERLVISVSDTGPGVPESEKEKIFDKYYRSASSIGIKGTGLGLAIVKAVAEAHGGRVELESDPGRGSTFRLVIPVRGPDDYAA